MKIDIKFLAEACGGKIIGSENTFVTGVKIDSRECEAGDMFVCVIGEKNDGHRFAKSAYDLGCRTFLMSDPDAAKDTAALSEDVCICLAEDTQEAFRLMAKAYLDRINPIKIGVTGSVGKTTTKMLTAAVMSAKYNTICTRRNYNTQLGMCLTCFLADEQTRCIVFEMGMDRKNEIAEYVEWVRPDAAIITNVGISHMEKLGSRDAIADAKLEITGKFGKDSVLVVNSASDYLKTEEEIRERSLNKEPYKIVLAGKDICYTNLENNGTEGIRFKINGTDFSLPLLGEHNALDALLAVAMGLQWGIDEAAASGALAGVTQTERRMNVAEAGGILLLDDSYNASPDSMKAAISALSSVSAKRRIAVLSDMLELGDADFEGHLEVGRFAAENNVNILVAVGEKREYYFMGVSESKTSSCNVICLENIESAESIVMDLLKPGDAVLVKGSNSTGVYSIAKKIKESFK